MNYEEKFWNKYEELHDRYKRIYEYSNNIILILGKMSEVSKEFSKSLRLINNRNLTLIEDNETSVGKAIESINFDIKLQTDEFDELSDSIRLNMVDSLKKTLDETFTTEKEKYIELKKSIKSHTNNLNSLKKSESNFDFYAKASERAAIESVKMKLSIANNEEKERSKKITEQSFLEAKNLEKIYKQNIEISNKSRVDVINKQKDLLQAYQKIDNKINASLKALVSFYITSVKKLTSSILIDVESVSDKFSNINIQEDINSFIDNNKSDELPDKEILFHPYIPQTNPDEKSDNPEIAFEIIKEIKSNLSDVLPNFDIEKEIEKSKIRKLSLNFFKTNVEFKPEEKAELLSVIKNSEKRRIFLYTLNKQRTTGKFARSYKLMEELKLIINQILDISQKENDYESAKNCIILSQTFYVDNSKDKEKVYLFESISQNQWLLSIEFWYGITDLMIEKEIVRNQINISEMDSKETGDETKRRLSNIVFSQVLSYSANMIEFKIDNQKILEFINHYSEKYSLDPELVEPIIKNVNEN